MRRRLYFSRDAGVYQARHWYDHVPEDDYREHVASGAAESVYAEECHCLLTYSGRLVRSSGSLSIPCPDHATAEQVVLAPVGETAIHRRIMGGAT